MALLTQKYQSFIHNKAQRDNKQSFSFHYKADFDEQQLGNYYILFEIQAESADRAAIFETIIHTFTQHYYRAELEGFPEERFERAIRAINSGLDEVKHFYEQKHLKFSISGVIITTINQKMFFSAVGNINLYLIRNTKKHTLYKPRHEHSFSEVLAGEIDTQDLLLANTVSSDKLIEQVMELHKPNNVLVHARKMVETFPDEVIAAITIAYSEEKQAPKVDQIETKKRTPKLLLTVFSLSNKISKSEKKQKSDTSESNVVKSTTKSKKRPAKKPSSGLKSAWNTLWGKYINPNPKAALTIVIVVIVLIVAVWIGWTIFNPNNQHLLNTYNQAEQLYTKAQSESKNGNTNSAEAALNQAQNTLSKLSKTDQTTLENLLKGKKKQSLQDLNKSIIVLLDELHGIFRVDAKKQYSSSAANSFNQISLLSDTALMVDPIANILQPYSIVKNTPSKSIQNNLLQKIFSMSSSKQLAASYGLNQVGLTQIRADGTISEQKNVSGKWPTQSVALAAFNSSLFFLSPTDNQIYKFNKASSGFYAPTNYLKNPKNSVLDDTTSIAVNGAVFVARKNGEILLFDQGLQRDFKIKNMPPLDNITQISLSDSGEQLVLLDSNKLAFIFVTLKADQAEFKRELIVKNTDSISSFSLDSTKNTIYFSSNSDLYSIPTP